MNHMGELEMIAVAVNEMNSIKQDQEKEKVGKEEENGTNPLNQQVEQVEKQNSPNGVEVSHKDASNIYSEKEILSKEGHDPQSEKELLEKASQNPEEEKVINENTAKIINSDHLQVGEEKHHSTEENSPQANAHHDLPKTTPSSLPSNLNIMS